MTRLGSLFREFHSPKTRTTLWDGWLPMSVLWPAVGDPPSAGAMRDFYRASLLARPIDDEGYVSTVQHPGLAHSWGWPFPTWPQSRGRGWHFSLAGNPYAVMLKTPVATSRYMPRINSKYMLFFLRTGTNCNTKISMPIADNPYRRVTIIGSSGNNCLSTLI